MMTNIIYYANKGIKFFDRKKTIILCSAFLEGIKIWNFFQLQENLTLEEQCVSFGTTIIMRTLFYAGTSLLWSHAFNQPYWRMVILLIIIHDTAECFGAPVTRIEWRKDYPDDNGGFTYLKSGLF